METSQKYLVRKAFFALYTVSPRSIWTFCAHLMCIK